MDSSKDHVEHLRAVHFTLVILSVALIAILTAQPEGKIQRARTQLQHIEPYLDNLDIDRYDVDTEIPTAVAPHNAKWMQPDKLFVLHPENGEVLVQHYTLKPTSANPLKRLPAPIEIDSNIHADVGCWPPKEQRVSIATYKAFWDCLNSIKTVTVPAEPPHAATETSGNIYLFVPQRVYRSFEGRDARGFEGTHIQLTLMDNPERYEFTFESNHFPHLESDTPPYDLKPDLHAPVATEKIIFHALTVYRNKRQLLAGHDGSFESAFPDLDELIARPLPSIGAAEAKAILLTLEQNSKQSFQAFGITFPIKQTVRWGIFLLLGTQLYFLIHLNELKGKLSKDDEGWQVAWIGMYSGWGIATVFVISVLVLPVGAVATLLQFGELSPDKSLNSALSAVGLISSALIAGFTGYARAKMKKVEKRSTN